MPSIPQSLLWISLVVLWLFVLVPMLISKRDAVRRTSDVALATRVLNSGRAARLLRTRWTGGRTSQRSGLAAVRTTISTMTSTTTSRTSRRRGRSSCVATAADDERRRTRLPRRRRGRRGLRRTAGGSSRGRRRAGRQWPKADELPLDFGDTEDVDHVQEDESEPRRRRRRRWTSTSTSPTPPGWRRRRTPICSCADSISAARRRRYESKTAAAVTRAQVQVPQADADGDWRCWCWPLPPRRSPGRRSMWWACGSVGAVTAALPGRTCAARPASRSGCGAVAPSGSPGRGWAWRTPTTRSSTWCRRGCAGRVRWCWRSTTRIPIFEHLDYAPFARHFDLPRAAGQ